MYIHPNWGGLTLDQTKSQQVNQQYLVVTEGDHRCFCGPLGLVAATRLGHRATVFRCGLRAAAQRTQRAEAL